MSGVGRGWLGGLWVGQIRTYEKQEKTKQQVGLSRATLKVSAGFQSYITYGNFKSHSIGVSERFKSAEFLKPNFRMRKLKIFIWKTIFMQYRNI